MSRMAIIWKILNAPLSVVFLGFILTGWAGVIITHSYQKADAQRERKYEVFKQEVQEARDALEQITLHMCTRSYAIRKIEWALERRDKREIQKYWDEYTPIKDEWNIKLSCYRNKLKQLVDERLAYELLDKENGMKPNESTSIHGYFIIAHNSLKQFSKAITEDGHNEEEIMALQKKAHQDITILFEEIDKFINNAYGVFLNKYKLLK